MLAWSLAMSSRSFTVVAWVILGSTTLLACGRIDYQARPDGGADASPSDTGTDATTDAGCSVCSATTYDAEGSGTPADPYLIATAAQWVDLAGTPDAWDRAFKLIRDIDLGAIPGDHTPVGSEMVPFTGIVDGNGLVVRGYRTTTGAMYSGLFGYVDSPDAVIRDIAVVDAEVAGGERSGALVGFLTDGTVERAASLGPACHVTSPAYANHKGGLIGETSAPAIVTDVFSTCRLSGTGIGVAGLIGHNEGTLTNGYYYNGSFPVSATARVAGIIGWNAATGVIRNTFTAAAVEGNTDWLDVALHVGTPTGMAINSFFDSGWSVANLGTGGTTENGTPVDVAASPGYFFDRTQAPVASWDFDSVWAERAGDYPTLRFLNGRY